MLEGVLTETRYPTNEELNNGLLELMSTINKLGRSVGGQKRPKPRGRKGEHPNRGSIDEYKSCTRRVTNLRLKRFWKVRLPKSVI